MTHPPQTVLRVVALYRSGYGARSIADQTGIPEDTIINWLRGRKRASVTGGRVMCGKRPGKQLAIYRQHNG